MQVQRGRLRVRFALALSGSEVSRAHEDTIVYQPCFGVLEATLVRRRAYVAFNGAGGSKNSRIKDPLKRVYGPDMIFADSTACMFGFAMSTANTEKCMLKMRTG
jgi:hypothetical protein